MGSITGRGDKSQEPIRTRKVDGPGQTYWQALLSGDQEIVAEILSEPQNNLSPSAVFDTSDLEEWKNYRFNIRGLSKRQDSRAAPASLMLLLLLLLQGSAALALPWLLAASWSREGGTESTAMWSSSPVLLVGGCACLWEHEQCLGYLALLAGVLGT